jgi:hypothetical protein
MINFVCLVLGFETYISKATLITILSAAEIAQK